MPKKKVKNLIDKDALLRQVCKWTIDNTIRRKPTAQEMITFAWVKYDIYDLINKAPVVQLDEVAK